jgi:hypothetical protein
VSRQVLARLAVPAAAEDRRRARLVSWGLAGAGAVLLGAVAIATASGSSVDDVWMWQEPGYKVYATVRTGTLARFVADERQRERMTFGALLLAVPFLIFAVQALRTGTAARERRLASLCLAGATRSQLRGVVAREGTRAAVRGVVGAIPAYLLLWTLLGVLPPSHDRLLPPPTRLLAVAWVCLALVLLTVAAVGAVLASDVARVTPLGVSRRVRRALSARDAVLPVAAALAVASQLVLRTLSDYRFGDVASYGAMVAIVVLALSGGKWLILLVGQLALRWGVIGTITGRRLLTDVRTPGRVAGVLFAAGVVLGVASVYGSQKAMHSTWDDADAAVAGAGLAAAGALVTSIVACGSLVIGAVEEVLQQRRGTAVLVALAASPDLAHRVVGRQMVLAAVPATVLGAALGPLIVPGFDLAGLWWLVALPVAGVVGWGGALAAAWAVRPTVLACTGAENLRAP